MANSKKISAQSEHKNKYLVLFISDNPEKQNELIQSLSHSVYKVCAVLPVSCLITNQPESKLLIDDLKNFKPNIIVIDVLSPQACFYESIQAIVQHKQIPIIMFSAEEGTQHVPHLINSGVTTYIVNKSNFTGINTIIISASAYFDQLQQLQKELSVTKNKLANLRTIEQAKFLLMQNKQYSEQEAYHCMRKMAMDNGHKLEDIAKNVLSLAAIL